ncbi:cyanogenic beta-glucosidase-like [Senna tora]|uniref:Cyanogenic beta-glucosidase-like n=1 Tax=Senna tora TaxID=362788 RepID=A0A834U2X4_9FABA|nr:cyanogenic beta-glucosidase-like [Senna tora]
MDITNNGSGFFNRSSFPEGFMFGVSSSAYQFEGAAKEGGKGPSIWDVFTHKYPEKIKDRSNGDVATDQYHRYKEDVALMKDMNLDSYRLSISWSRILPKGKLSGGVNREGINYYNNLINELLANGVAIAADWTLPTSDSPFNIAAADRARDFMIGWCLEPLVRGRYPKSMRHLVGRRLPKLSAEERRVVIGSFDFIGINHYSTRYAAHAPQLSNATHHNYLIDSLVQLSDPIVYPRGLRDLLLYINSKYNNPLIYITENGVNDMYDSMVVSLEESLTDAFRVDFLRNNLYYLNTTIKDGVNVKGYFAWSFLDDFEWNTGHNVRYGLIYVDYNNNLKRYPKLSAQWFRNFLQTNIKPA